MSQQKRTPATRADYRYFLDIATRAVDLDQNGHINQAVYHSLYETLLLTYLKRECDVVSSRGELGFFCVENGCVYGRELDFPQTVEAGMRIAHVGNSSVRFENALFTAEQAEAAATGFFVIVFVDTQTRRPVSIPQHIREKLEQMRVK